MVVREEKVCLPACFLLRFTDSLDRVALRFLYVFMLADASGLDMWIVPAIAIEIGFTHYFGAEQSNVHHGP